MSIFMVFSHFVSFELFILKELNTLSLVMLLPVKKVNLHTFFTQIFSLIYSIPCGFLCELSVMY